MSTKGKLRYIHLFRGIAILFIVASHIFWSNGDHPEIKHAIRLLLSNSTIFFLIISGFLFEYLSDNYEPVKYLTKKVKFILLPYLVCSIPIIAFLLYRFPEENTLSQITNYLISGSHLGPYWYIPVIMVFFIISPAIIYLKKFKAFQFFLIISLLYSLLTMRPESYNVLNNLIYFFGFFHLGIVMAMHRHLLEKWFSSKKSLLFHTLAWTITYTSLVFSISPPYRTLQLLLLGGLLMNIAYKIRPSKAEKALSLLADYSFGIYFIHQYVINIFAIAAGRLGINYQNLTYSLIIFPLVIISSILIIFFIKKATNPLVSRYLIGS